MKKLSVLFICALLLCGCSSKSAPQQNEEPTVETVKEINTEELSEELIECYIAGSFVATVRHLIPDYCFDGTTLTTAVVTLFQDGPIAIYVGEEIASELTEGERYVFTVKDNHVRTVTKEDFELGYVDVRDAVIMKNVRIDSVRPAEEYEAGLDTCWLEYTGKNGETVPTEKIKAYIKPNDEHIDVIKTDDVSQERSYTINGETSFTFIDTSNLFVNENSSDKTYTTSKYSEFLTHIKTLENPSEKQYSLEVKKGRIISIYEINQ